MPKPDALKRVIIEKLGSGEKMANLMAIRQDGLLLLLVNELVKSHLYWELAHKTRRQESCWRYRYFQQEQVNWQNGTPDVPATGPENLIRGCLWWNGTRSLETSMFDDWYCYRLQTWQISLKKSFIAGKSDAQPTFRWSIGQMPCVKESKINRGYGIVLTKVERFEVGTHDPWRVDIPVKLIDSEKIDDIDHPIRKLEILEYLIEKRQITKNNGLCFVHQKNHPKAS